MTGCECPIDLDERTELYFLGRLPEEEARRFDAHLASCPACLREVYDSEVFFESMRLALEELREEVTPHVLELARQ